MFRLVSYGFALVSDLDGCVTFCRVKDRPWCPLSELQLQVKIAKNKPSKKAKKAADKDTLSMASREAIKKWVERAGDVSLDKELDPLHDPQVVPSVNANAEDNEDGSDDYMCSESDSGMSDV